MNNPAISVIMLTYNREQCLGNMIECIQAQTFTDFEFIIVDNGSSDDSGKIADEFSLHDGRIQTIHRKRGNIGSGRNTGLDFSTGEYIAFVDDDDICEPDYLQFLYALATENVADVSICGATWSHLNEKHIMTAEEATKALLWRKWYNVAFPTKLLKRSLFDNQRFLENGKYDDIYLMPKMMACANKVAYHGLSKYHFDRHGGNNSAWTQNHRLLDKEILQEYLHVYAERTAWLSRRFPRNADMWRYFNWSFMLSMVEKVTRLELSDCHGLREAMLADLKANKSELLNGGYLLEHEREWFREYV